jgi:protein TonB
MDLKNTLIESGNLQRKRSWRGIATSMIAHSLALAAIVFGGLSASKEVAAEDSPIAVFVNRSAAAAPPPPPPPPPAAAPASATPATPTPTPETPQPVQVPRESFVAPTDEPEDLPEVTKTTPVESPITTGQNLSAVTSAVPAQPVVGGVPGGVVGGVPGGVQGGEVGGVTGGQLGGVIGGQIGGTLGGVIGGTPGGQVGGQVGGTGTAPAPEPPAPPSGPLRVGGDVKAPVVVNRVDPEYTEVARRARVAGVVVVEAIIDKHGNVDRVKVVKGLPMGLSESAVNAVRRWKFRPGTQAGRPVDVIFNLTVVFRLGADGGSRSTPTPSQPKSKPAPAPVETPEPEAPEPVEPAPSEPLPEPPSDDQ